MKQANHPTSQFRALCDQFDVELIDEIHETDGGFKLKRTMRKVDGSAEVSISLFREDVEAEIQYLQWVLDYIEKRRSHETERDNP